MNSKVIDQDGVSISEAPNSRQWVLSARASTLGGIHRILDFRSIDLAQNMF